MFCYRYFPCFIDLLESATQSQTGGDDSETLTDEERVRFPGFWRFLHCVFSMLQDEDEEPPAKLLAYAVAMSEQQVEVASHRPTNNRKLVEPAPPRASTVTIGSAGEGVVSLVRLFAAHNLYFRSSVRHQRITSSPGGE